MHRMIRPLFAPYYQFCFVAGTAASITWGVVLAMLDLRGPPDWSIWAIGRDFYLDPMILGLTLGNSFLTGWVYLRHRAQIPAGGGFNPGVLAMTVFVGLAILEGTVIQNLPAATEYRLNTGEVVFTAIIGFLAASIFYVPLGFLADRWLGHFYRIDPSVHARNFHARTH